MSKDKKEINLSIKDLSIGALTISAALIWTDTAKKIILPSLGDDKSKKSAIIFAIIMTLIVFIIIELINGASKKIKEVIKKHIEYKDRTNLNLI